MSRQVIDGAYDIDFLPTQQAVINCIGEMQTPNILYYSGFGSGKTRLGGEVALQLGSVYPGIKAGVFRKTRTAVKDTTYKTFIDQVLPPEYIAKGGAGWNKTDLDITLVNDSNIHFFGIDNFERKASLEFDVIINDEATEFEEEDHVMLSGRLRGKVIPMPMKIDICNPGAPGSYLHKTFKIDATPEELDKDFKSFHATSYENIHNPKSYFDRLRKWVGSQYYDRYVLGLWKAFRGTVYEQYDPKVHVIAPFEIPANWPKKIVVDFGYDNPLAILWIAKDPGTGIKYVYRQFYKTHQLVKKACEICKDVTIKAHEHIEAARADHDAENRAQFEEYWMPTVPAVKTVKVGIQHVQERLLEQPNGKRGLYIFKDDWAERDGFWYGNFDPDPVLKEENKPMCLQDELPKYMWGKDDLPVKENDHACFTGDTLVTIRGGEKRIDEVIVGDEVLTRSGYRRVVDSKMTSSNAPVYEFSIAGRVIKCTPNHRIITQKGKKEAGLLTRLDIIFILNKTRGQLWLSVLKRLFIRASSFEGILIQKIGLTEIITGRTRDIFGRASRRSIKRYGLMRTDQYHTDTTFTTMMKTRATTKLKTSFLSVNLNTCRFTQKNIKERTEKKRSRILTMCAQPHQLGTDLLTEKSGIQSTPKNTHLEKTRKENACAYNAEANTKRRNCHEQDFVRTTVRPHLGGFRGLISFLESAPIVGAALKKINTTLVYSVQESAVLNIDSKPLGTARVYNLTVEHDHEFFANGILVSNCDAIRYDEETDRHEEETGEGVQSVQVHRQASFGRQ